MSDDEIEAFLNLEFPGTTKPYYDRRTHGYHEPFIYKRWKVWNVFFLIMAFAGMQPGEVAALRVGDVDFGRQGTAQIPGSIINIRKMEKRLETVEEDAGIEVPPELHLEPASEAA